VHLSSRYLQLIKSQVDNFSEDTKTFVDKIDDFFIHSKSLTCRINVASVNQINGVLNKTLINSQNVDTFHLGETLNFSKMLKNFQSARDNITSLKLLKM